MFNPASLAPKKPKKNKEQTLHAKIIQNISKYAKYCQTNHGYGRFEHNLVGLRISMPNIPKYVSVMAKAKDLANSRKHGSLYMYDPLGCSKTIKVLGL